MKRSVCVCIAALMAASLLAACGKSDAGTQGSSGGGGTSAVSESGGTTAVSGGGGTSTVSDSGETSAASDSGETSAVSDSGETSAVSGGEDGSEGSPEVTTVVLGEYKGLTYTPFPTEVTDEEVEEQIQSILDVYPTMVPVDRPAKDGDTVNIDYVGKKDGVAFDGGSGTGFNLKLGSGLFIEGFEDGLIGASKGEERKLELTFPENSPNEDLAGQDVIFEVKVNEVQEAIPAKLDEEFLANYTDYTTVEEFRADTRKKLEAYKISQAEIQKEYDVLAKAMANAEITVSTEETEEYYQQLYDVYEDQAAAAGIDLETMAGYYGMDLDTFKLQLMAEADITVQQNALVREIAAKEGITVEDADREALAEEYGYGSVDEMHEAVKQENSDMVILAKKVIDLLVENAVAES